MNTQQLLALTSIRIDGGTQSRVSISDDVVSEYAAALTDGLTLPPVLVFFDGIDNWLADGFHRYLANTKVGAVTLAADVRAGSLSDALLYAYGANQSHGLRRTNDDKRKAVSGTLDLKPEWSDRAIAKHVGVSVPFVSAVRSPAVAKRQDEARLSNKRPIEKPQDEDGCNPITPLSAPSTGIAENAKLSEAPQNAQPHEDDEDDEHGNSDPLELLEIAQRDVERMTEELIVMQADDLKAEALKWRRAFDAAVRSQCEAMDRAKQSTDREVWTMKQLRRCGKAVGQDDPVRIAAAVEAAVGSARLAA